MPAPSESFGSQPTAPRCVRLRSTVSPCSTMVCDLRPLMFATKPTPQASCSFSGRYSPCGSKPMGKVGFCGCAQKVRSAFEYTFVVYVLQGLLRRSGDGLV